MCVHVSLRLEWPSSSGQLKVLLTLEDSSPRVTPCVCVFVSVSYLGLMKFLLTLEDSSPSLVQGDTVCVCPTQA